MRTRSWSSFTVGLCAVGALCAVSMGGCKKGKNRKQSELARWVDSPTTGSKQGKKIVIPDLGVNFEIPDTLYVYKDCGEANHAPEGSDGWIPVITCRSSAGGEFEGFGAGEEEEEDPFAEEEIADASGAELINLTVYVTKKDRPLDERAVTWFENQYKQAGFDVDEISYQSDYQKKEGIYTRLHVVDDETGTPEREIVQFFFPRGDVVFIAKTEYPFGDTRAIDKDWQYILWNFDFGAAAAAAGAPPAGAGGEVEE